MSIYKICLVFLLIICSNNYLIGVDFNTFSAQDLKNAVNYFGHLDLTWAITNNSPGVSAQQWNAAFNGINRNMVFSEDNPMQFRECKVVRSYAGTLTAAFGYHETGANPGTMLTWGQIDQYANNCGTDVIILTRGYWPGTDWRNKVDAVLRHPRLYAVAMQLGPNDFGKHYQVEFINNVLAAGKRAFFLLPLTQIANYPTQRQIGDFINFQKSHGVNMGDNRIVYVIARYDQPFIPVVGSTNSVDSAIKTAQRLR